MTFTDNEPTKIKICGLRCDAELYDALKAEPDYVGFVVDVPSSSRSVSAHKVRDLAALVPLQVKTVGVFVNAPVKQVAALLNEGVLDLAQLHGNEDETYLEALRAITDKPFIQAFTIHNIHDRDKAAHSSAPFVLLDGGAGQGRCFDWSLVQGLKRPYFLAGGLTLSLIELAITQLHPFAVDISSGVETKGMKDPDKMRAVVALVRALSATSPTFPKAQN